MTTLEIIKSQVKFYPDFPKKGVNFVDVLPLLSNAETFSALIAEISRNIHTKNIAAPEARGFLFGAPLLLIKDGVQNFIAFRKNGKLPYAGNDLQKITVLKEYGDDNLYFRLSDLENAQPTLDGDPAIEISIFDDVLATGGTAEGMAKQLNSLTINTPHGRLPVRVREFVFLAELADLKGRERLSAIAPTTALISF